MIGNVDGTWVVYKCCKASGKCVPSTAYCGEPGFNTKAGSYTCDNGLPNYFRDDRGGECEFTKDPAQICWGGVPGCLGDVNIEGACVSPQGDPQCICQNKRNTGQDYCGKILEGSRNVNAYCNIDCQCVIPKCRSDQDCKSGEKCCLHTSRCVSTSVFVGQYGETKVQNRNGNEYCSGVNENCDGLIGGDNDIAGCLCTGTCSSGKCANGNSCYYNVQCSPEGQWEAKGVDNNPSCPAHSDPCEILSDMAIFGTVCDSNYKAVADINKDKKINMYDKGEIAKHKTDSEWCNDKLSNNRMNPCSTSGIPDSYIYYCYHNGQATCDPISGWKCSYSKENCPLTGACAEGHTSGTYNLPGNPCYYNIQCSDQVSGIQLVLPGSTNWIGKMESLNAHCSGDILLENGICGSNGPIFKETNCNLFDGANPKPDGNYQIVDYSCRDNQCKPEILYSKQINEIAVFGLNSDNQEAWVIEPGVVVAGCRCDINSDSKINMFDVGSVARKFGKNSGDTGYDLSCDINKDGKINMWDIGAVARLFGSDLTDSTKMNQCKQLCNTNS